MNDFREDQAQIGELLIRYATGVDQRDWPLFRTCWTADVEADYGQIGTFSGVDALTDFMVASHDAMGPTHHRLSNFVIDVSGDTATARSYVHAILIAVPGDPSSWIDAVGNYEDTLVRTSDGWRIDKRVVNMARVMTANSVV
ncbi:nuclear transport factor 2 family protein [Nocardia bovistercoris]|uniref:Nuclear transport factor 2 family protein n=1 Tax=Nocardia bovistercoris TaxID=2785916 RepID=A0A931N436_9NOCA|nr:nuclear transport factor 2 family protein [Nocardia bovistercoris]MBH0778444.1 nuclear transport factor 2 family protein [Nocardia bovistercoris]